MVVGEVAERRDLIVIGAGPGGYEAALRAAELGRQVTLVDRRGLAGLGGECLHTGCIPSKTLIELAGSEAHRTADRAVPNPILKRFQADKALVIETIRAGVERAVVQSRIEVVHGIARFITGGRVVIERPDGLPAFLEYGAAVIATGSRPTALPTMPFDGQTVLDSAMLLALEELPQSLAVVGGGYIGIELGTALAKLGVAVTIVEMGDQLLPGLDVDLAAVVAKSLGNLGVTVELRTLAIEADHGSLRCRRVDGDAELAIAAERVLVAIGRRPNTDDLGIDAAAARLEPSGLVHTDAFGRAGPALFAIGDVRAGPALAHKASAEGRTVAELAAGVVGHRDVGEIPLVVFSDPEVASVGRTSRDVRASAGELVAGKVPLSASGRAATLEGAQGFVRVVADRATGSVVGVQLAAPHASEMIATATMAIELGAVLDDLDGLVFAHPTLSELLALAARAGMKARA